MYIYAHINKNTLRFVREQKAISLNYVTRITKFKEDKLSLWENDDSGKFPTINQAKAIAKCYRIPFAGLYMNASDINIKHLPKMRNLRTLPDAMVDNSALNLAIADVLSARDLLLESKKALKEPATHFNVLINCPDDNVAQWAEEIRRTLGIDSNVQYKCRSTRQLYLYIRNLVEASGAFVHCFTGIDTEIVRGFAIYDDLMPIIGLNNDDRYPAKTFSIIHELVHLIKRSSAVCNDMTDSISLQSEEVFCNAVAGAVLVPRVNLRRQLGEYTPNEIDLDIVSSLADKFSVSKEVICRRLLDTGRISQQKYSQLITVIKLQFENDRKAAREYRKLTGQGVPRNMSREVIDQNSSALCRTFFHGYREGIFDKQDISRYLGIKQNHIEKFIWEVSKW